MANKEYEMAIKIAGKVEASLKSSTRLTKKELQDIAKAAANTNNSMRSQFGTAFNDLDKGFGKIEKVALKTFNAVANAVKVGATAVAGVVGASTKVGSDFEKQMSTVGAISNANSEDMKKLSEKAKEMGANTVFSATEAGKAMEYMAMAGWKADDMLNGIEGIMNLAAASGEELGTVSDIVTDALTAFGLSAKDAGHFSDVLAAASSNSNTNVSMMGETFKYAAPIAGALGYTIEDTAFAIGLLANSGIKSSQAGTQLRKMLSQLAGGAKITSEAFGEITISSANADGSMRPLKDVLGDLKTAFSQMSEQEQVANAKALVGQQAMSGLLAIINSSQGDWDKLATSIDNSAGAAERMADVRLDNLAGDVTLAKSALEGLGIQIYEDIKEPMRAAVQGFSQWVSETTRWAKNSGVIKNISTTIVQGLPTAKRVLENAAKGIIAFSKPLLDVGMWCVKNPRAIANVLIGIGSAMAAYKIASTAHKVAGGISAIVTALSNPAAGLIVAGTAAVGVIAGLASAYKNWQIETGKKNLAEHFGNISLSVEQINEAARHLVGSGTLARLDEAMSAFDDAKGYSEAFNDTANTLQKLNWKVGIGIELSEKDKQTYLDGVTDLIANSKESVLSEQLGMQLHLNNLFGDDSGEEIKEQFKSFYTSSYAELERLGTDLQNTVNEAFNDGLLTIPEAEKIAELQQQIADIEAQLATSEYNAGLDIARKEFLRNVNSESFINLMDATAKETQAATERFEKSQRLAKAKLYTEYDQGKLSKAEFDKSNQSLDDAYEKQILTLKSQAHMSLMEAVEEGYAAEMQQYASRMVSVRNEALAKAFSEDELKSGKAEDWGLSQFSLFNNFKGGLNVDEGTKQAMSQMWEQLKPQQDEFMKLATEYREKGQEIPTYILEGLAEGSKIGALAGDKNSIWFQIGQSLDANGPEYQQIIQNAKANGEAIPDALLNAMNKDVSTSASAAADNIYNSTKSSFTKKFSNPFKVDFRVQLNNTGVDMIGAPFSNAAINQRKQQAANSIMQSKGIPHYAAGGIINDPTVASFAEEGPEAAIPLDGSKRSISLWQQAGQMLGVIGKSKAEDNLSKLESVDNMNSGVNITYAPVQNFNSGTPTKDDIVSANRISQQEFEKMYEQLMKKQRRTAFAS